MKKRKKEKKQTRVLVLVPTWPDSVGYIACKPITDGKCQATFKIFATVNARWMDRQTDR